MKTMFVLLTLTALISAADQGQKIDPTKGLNEIQDTSKEVRTTIPALDKKKKNKVSFEAKKSCTLNTGSTIYSENEPGYENCVQQQKDNVRSGR